MDNIVEYTTILDVKSNIKEENSLLMKKAQELNQRIDKCFKENKNTYEIEYLLKQVKEISKIITNNINKLENINKLIKEKQTNRKSIHLKGANIIRLKQNITNILRKDNNKEEKTSYRM